MAKVGDSSFVWLNQYCSPMSELLVLHRNCTCCCATNRIVVLLVCLGVSRQPNESNPLVCWLVHHMHAGQVLHITRLAQHHITT
jgi:hypothetical protein